LEMASLFHSILMHGLGNIVMDVMQPIDER